MSIILTILAIAILTPILVAILDLSSELNNQNLDNKAIRLRAKAKRMRAQLEEEVTSYNKDVKMLKNIMSLLKPEHVQEELDMLKLRASRMLAMKSSIQNTEKNIPFNR